MALINLEPGEEFSHAHEVVSTTAAVQGDVELTVSGQTVRLTAVPVVIPANTVHVMRNVGVSVATLRCGYVRAGGER